MKIKNVAVALLVLFVVLTTKKNKKSSYVNNLVVITPLEHEKSYKTPPYEQSCCYHAPWNTKKNWSEKNLAQKKIQMKLTIKKFLRPPQDIIQVFHTLMLYLFVR